jgi:hypothetical protein
MAILAANPLVQGARGSFGTLVLRQVRGKTVLSAKPNMPSAEKQSELQKLNRDKFKMASLYAKRMMRDDVMKAFYWKRAKKLKLPNAYTAAIKDYMCKTRVSAIDLKRYTGKVGGSVTVYASKEHSSVSEVFVTVMTKEGQEIEKGKAIPHGSVWMYKNTVKTNGAEGLRFIVETKDVLNNWTRATKILGEEVYVTYGWNAPPTLDVVKPLVQGSKFKV